MRLTHPNCGGLIQPWGHKGGRICNRCEAIWTAAAWRQLHGQPQPAPPLSRAVLTCH